MTDLEMGLILTTITRNPERVAGVAVVQCTAVEQQNSGTVEHWNSGTVEQWNSGTVELWNCGVVVERPSRKLSPIPASLDRYAADLLRPDREKSSIMELISKQQEGVGGFL